MIVVLGSSCSVPSMVNLGEIKLHIGVEHGKKTQAQAVYPWMIGGPLTLHSPPVASRRPASELQRVYLPNHEAAAT